jgi:hypothetical protein
MTQIHEEITYLLIIDKLSPSLIKNRYRIDNLERFWNMEIPISKRMYDHLRDNSDMMLLVDHTESQLLIPNFSLFFIHDIDISYYDEVHDGSKVIMKCMLIDIACFPTDHPGAPF